MKLSISIGFDEEAAENIMKVAADLKKCSRKGFFRKKSEFRMHLLVMDEVTNIQPILKEAELMQLEPFTVKINSLDRSRRDGGDIYWVRAEENEILTELNKTLIELAEENGYEYSKKAFKPRVELGQVIIARPDFEVEPFEARVKNIAIVKHIPSYDRVNYDVYYRRELKK